MHCGVDRVDQGQGEILTGFGKLVVVGRHGDDRGGDARAYLENADGLREVRVIPRGGGPVCREVSHGYGTARRVRGLEEHGDLDIPAFFHRRYIPDVNHGHRIEIDNQKCSRGSIWVHSIEVADSIAMVTEPPGSSPSSPDRRRSTVTLSLEASIVQVRGLPLTAPSRCCVLCLVYVGTGLGSVCVDHEGFIGLTNPGDLELAGLQLRIAGLHSLHVPPSAGRCPGP